MSVVLQKASQEKRKAEREFKGNLSQNIFQDWTVRQYSSPWHWLVCCESVARFWWLGAASVRSGGACPGWAQPAPDAGHGGAALPRSSCLWENVFKEGKKLHMQPGLRERSIRNSAANTDVREEQGDEVLQQRFPCSLWWRAEEQVFPCSLGTGSGRSSHPHYSLWGTPQWSRWVFPEEAMAHGEPMLKEGAAERN